MPIEITMPALSPTMTDGTLAKWLKKEGDNISAGDVIAEIETDKATMEVEAVDEGILGKILVKDGTDNVPVNKVIALLLEEGEDKKALDSYKVSEPEVAVTEEAEAIDGEEAPKVAASSGGGVATVAHVPPKLAPKPPRQSLKREDVAASPVAKRLAQKNSINLNAIIGTGPKGRIIKADVEEAMLAGGGGGVVKRDASEFIQVPNDNMRKTIAKRLLESKQQVPHFYLTIDCELDKLMELRKELNGKAMKDATSGDAGEGNPAYKASVNDFIIKAVALSLRDVPEANSSWYDDAIVQYSNVDVSVAVATEGGLITPIVKNADQKSIMHISNEMKDLAKRARENALKPEEYQGGGFSISNLGMFGIKQFSAIINPPQSCILAVGAGEERAVIKNGEIKSALVMTVTLAVDHRSVDGAVGAKFLAAFKHYIESPVTMFI